MVWRVARLCPEKARKGPPVWTVVVLGEYLEEVAGCPRHFPNLEAVWRRTREAHSPEVCVRRSISPGDRRWQCELVSSLLGGYQHGTPRRLPSCCALSPSCGCSQKRSAKCASLSSPSALRAAAPPPPVPVPPRPDAETLDGVQGVLQAVSEPAF